MTAISIATKYGLPPFKEERDFEQWKHELEIWQMVTDLAKEKQGPVLFLSLSEKTRQACAGITKEELAQDDGVSKVIEKLRELYSVSKEQAMFSAYERFESFRRTENMSITEYINQFEQLNMKLTNYEIILPSVVLAYQVLKIANLPKEKRDLARATIPDLTYQSMKKQIKAIYDHCASTEKIDCANNEEIKVENPDDTVLYGGTNWRQGSSRGRYHRGGRNYNYNANFQRGGPRKEYAPTVRPKPTSRPGKNNPCHNCQSIFHWAPDCPDKNRDSNIQYLAENFEQCFLEQEVSESLNCAVVDSGCTKNVVGANWLKCFLDTLPPTFQLQTMKSNNVFRFGPSKSYLSTHQVSIPANIGDMNINILTDVVECELPLLLSKQFLKDAESNLDFVNDEVTLFGKKIPLQHTSSGHYCVPITPKQQLHGEVQDQSGAKVYLSVENLHDKTMKEKREIAVKLHKQFGHPLNSDKLKNLLQDAQIVDDELFKLVRDVTNECDVCDRYRKVRTRPVVTIPLANDFNECIALDLKFVNIRDKNYIILHMIDVFTRYSQAAIIQSKKKETIVNAILKQWVSIFGTPQSILSDNGGEFDNQLLRDIAELLDTKVITTAAYSPWSNGIVERHNAVIENMLLKITSDSNCSVTNALVWSISAKNALHNNRGYSPNQLVFGRNPNLPSVLTAKPPALRTCTPSYLIAEHLNALHLARKSFIESESSKRIKLALQRQTRTATSKEFSIGNHVYYKRPDGKAWHGPATIAGIDGKIVLVRHGGYLLRVSPVHLQKVGDDGLSSLRNNKCDSAESGCNSTVHSTITASEICESSTSSDILVAADIDELFMLHDVPVGEQGTSTEELGAANNATEDVDILVDERNINEAQILVSANVEEGTIVTVANDDADNELVEEIANMTVDELYEEMEEAVEEITENETSVDSATAEHIESSASTSLLSSVLLPRIRDRVRFVDPDTSEEAEFLVISRAGKVKAGNKSWFNVKNLGNSVMKSVDFASVEWSKLEDEVFFSAINSPEVLQAQVEELEKWKEYGVYEEVPDEGQSAITTRWVMTEKMVADKNVVKARLVARGFEEDVSHIRTDSPTVSKENIRLVSTVAVAHKWKIHSIDVKAAFLQGFDIDREVYIVPPSEANTKLLWKLNKTVYGLSDASRSWYLKTYEELINKGAKNSTFDNALFYLRNGTELEGLICSHVDDFFFNGSQLFHNTIIGHLRNKFSLSKECFDKMLFIGIELAQNENYIMMHQKTYIESLKPVKITDMSRNRPLAVDEVRLLKGLIGQLQWISKLTRPDIAFDTCELSTKIKEATTADIRRANKLILKVQAELVAVCIQNVGDISLSSLYVYSDASFANLTGCGSQGGFIIFLVGKNGNASPLVWTSRKLKRVVKSPKAAETLALQDAAEHAFVLKSLLLEIYGLEEDKIPIVCVVDNESLFSSINSTNTIEDKRLYIDICCLRNMLSSKEITEVKLTSSEEQLADCLTKSTASAELLRRIIAGDEKLPVL